jgi:DNA topoisomerase-2
MNTTTNNETLNSSSNVSSELANKYQQKTDKQHILDNPDTYIGSIENVDAQMWLLSEDSTRIYEKNIVYISGLFKLFDEGVVNCRDHVVRMQSALDNNVPNTLPVTYIDITIQDDGTIIMTNDGNGIDVAKHPEYNIWIPELIFGHLRTSTNYDKNEKKITGGKNGFGFKLVLIWSTYGSVETIDHHRGLKYVQEFKNNLDEICPPTITKCKGKPYTKITFKPDYARLGIDGLTPDMIALLQKRAYDIAAITDKSIKVKYNSNIIPIKTFQQYIDLYIGDKTTSPRVYEEASERWEYAVALSPNHEFMQVSFVNGIHTGKGGKHVDYIIGQITRKLVDFIEKRKKIKVNASSIKEQIIFFLRCDVENPSFDSQTKDFMNTPSNKFGSSCTVSDKFIEKIAKMGVMDAACALTDLKETKMAKKTDGQKSKNIRGIPKLEDANWAGTERSIECTLLITEGDSAKAGCLSGLSSEDRNTFGVFPIKGKMMNVRGETLKKISENKEITDIKKILGLESDRTYESIDDVAKHLRYGRILFMTDQDLDGSHIKGLCINLFQCEWPTLARINGFIGFMNTPILKATKGTQVRSFYNQGEYDNWKEELGQTASTWSTKYYKGLGTSTKKEFSEYFAEKKMVGFTHNGETSNDAIDMVFNKKRSDDRKDWLEVYDRKSYLDTSKSAVQYEEFIHKELIHFSKYDCDRSIPNLMDGLKISLRKILFASFKRKLFQCIKVSQLSGYVSEHSCYHHGEESLNQAIVGMAQNFVGSNNINLLYPDGQFGTRLLGGKDSASPRYIFTKLTSIAKLVYPEIDNYILDYLDDDGTPVEPLFYAPIIPMVLVNGSKGIGTGFSTDIMCYNPLDIIMYIKCKLNCQTYDEEFIPYYDGFKGRIEKVCENKFMIKGVYEKIAPDKIRITELPIGYWTQDLKELLESLMEATVGKDGKKILPVIKDCKHNSNDTAVDVTVDFQKGKLEELESTMYENGCNGVEKLLKLFTSASSTNMHLFDYNDKLKKYGSVVEIIDDYFTKRLELYQVRKQYIIDALEKELVLLSNKSRYIGELLNDTIDLRRRRKEDVIAMLETKGYTRIDDEDSKKDYKYLTKMPMDSVTEENVDKINKEHELKNQELIETKATTVNQMWLRELDVLRVEYLKHKDEREMMLSNVEPVKKVVKKVVKKLKASA